MNAKDIACKQENWSTDVEQVVTDSLLSPLRQNCAVRPTSKPQFTQHSVLPPLTNNYPNQEIKCSGGAGARCGPIPINLT